MKKIAWVLPIIFVLVIIILACTLQPDQGDDTDHSSNDVSEESGIATEEWSEGDDRTRFDAFFARITEESYYTVLNMDNYTGNNELVDKDGNFVDLCFCEKTPCECGINQHMIVFGTTACSIVVSDELGMTFNVYDLSDVANIKRNTVRFDGINLEEYSLSYKIDRPYYYFSKKKTSDYSIVLDMSEAATGKIERLDFPAYAGGRYYPLLVYEGTLYSVSRQKSAYTALYSASPDDTEPTKLVDIPSSVGRFYACPGLGESLYFFNLEYDSESPSGLSLWQYVILETENGIMTRRVLREKNICDCVFSGTAFYYTLNDPERTREFPDKDHAEGKITYRDMTGGIIYRGEILGSAGEEFVCIDDYYLYGFNSKNSPIKKYSLGATVPFQHTFRHVAGNGVALSVNKEIDGRYFHTQLLVSLDGDSVKVTELEGSLAWGITLRDDALSGGTSCNWENRP